MNTASRLLSTGVLQANIFDEFTGIGSNIGITSTGIFYSSEMREGTASSLTSLTPMRFTSDKKLLVYNYFDEFGLSGPLSYSIARSSININEGQLVTFTITTNLNIGTTLYYTLSGVTIDDITDGSLSGSFATSGVNGITNNVVTVTTFIDYITDTDSMVFNLRTESTSGPIVASSYPVTISDVPYVAPPGQTEFTIPGTTTWTAPEGVRSICVVCVGGGGGGSSSGTNDGGAGGGGGGLGWKNNITVNPGQHYKVVIGSGGPRGTNIGSDGGDSYFISTGTVAGFGGKGAATARIGGAGGSYVGDGGGSGGNSTTSDNSSASAGGGAGGYSGNGGNANLNATGSAGSGGGGGAGGGGSSSDAAGAGGGVGILGQGTNGTGGTFTSQDGISGGGGSGGASGSATGSIANPSTGGAFGGGGGGSEILDEHGPGGQGAVRILWGVGRSYPSNATNV